MGNKQKMFDLAFKSFLICITFINIYYSQEYQMLWKYSDSSNIRKISLSNKGKIAVVGDKKYVSYVKILDDRDGILLVENILYSSPIMSSVDWSNKGDRFVTGGTGAVILWNENGELINYSLTDNSIPASVCWSPDDSTIAFESNGEIYIYNSDRFLEIQRFTVRHTNYHSRLSHVEWYNKDVLLIGSQLGDLYVYNYRKDSLIASYIKSYPNYNQIFDIKISSDNKYIVLAAYKKIFLFDYNTFKLIKSCEVINDWIMSVSWSPDNKFMAVGGNWNKLKIYDTNNERIVGFIPEPMDTIQSAIYSVFWSKEGNTILMSSQKSVHQGSVSKWKIMENMTEIKEENHINSKLKYKLEQNYPNPFNPVTTINYMISKQGYVQLKVYNILGKEVATLVHEEKSAGSYSINFNASDLPSGVYLYKLICDNFSETKKLIILK